MEIQPAEWPDPNGEKPADWPAEHWTAFQLTMLEDRSVRSTAEHLGYSPGTVTAWRKKYQARYGPTFWPTSRRPSAFPAPEATSYGAWVAGRSSRGGKWAALREGAANQFGEAAFLAREASAAALRLLLADEGRLRALEPRDILDLARAAEVLAHRADVLARIPPPHVVIIPPGAGGHGPPGLLDSLDRAGDDGAHKEALDIAETVVRHFQVLNGGGAEAEAS